MTLLMGLANDENRFLLNTSNKSEIATGYATLYGDAAGALAILGDLTKRQVYLVAKYINRDGEIIPQRVIDRPPTAELRENQTDQDTLPPYDVLDSMVEEVVDKGHSPAELVALGFPEKWVKVFFPDSIRRAEYSEGNFRPCCAFPRGLLAWEDECRLRRCFLSLAASREAIKKHIIIVSPFFTLTPFFSLNFPISSL